jgi:hypothetical protein
MLGQMQGTHTTNRRTESDYRGERLHNPSKDFQPVEFGNKLATNIGRGGPGTGRDVHACGSQGVHGATNPGNPRPQGRGILNNE